MKTFSSIFNATQENLKAEKALKDHKDTIAFLEEQHEYIK